MLLHNVFMLKKFFQSLPQLFVFSEISCKKIYELSGFGHFQEGSEMGETWMGSNPTFDYIQSS